MSVIRNSILVANGSAVYPSMDSKLEARHQRGASVPRIHPIELS